MPLAAPLASIVLSVALAAPTASPRDYQGTTESPELQEDAAVVVPASAALEAPAPPPRAEAETDVEATPVGDPLPEDALDEPALDEPALDGDESDDYADAYDPLRDSPEALRAASWVRSGVVFTVVGGLLTIGAIAMSFTEACDLSAGNGCQETAKVRASLAMGVPGGLLVAGGAAMLAVGKVQQRRLRASLSAGRQGFGATVVLHF